MRKFFKVLGLLLLGVVSMHAQQLPDPSFEDWSGETFENAIQPRYWHFSNVSQLGIANFNFAQRETGRNGGYAMKVQDQDLKVAGIGETSPGYIALGQPWAHVSSLTAINKATAGTYGGISWTSRPDTMTVWIKRSGAHTADENYNILFYSWRGRAEGASYKGKDGSCSTVPDTYRFDEESDIRIALDHNECSTVTPGQQVAEGWIYERAAYANWTKIKIPIYYLNDMVPEKCNVIFSASNYPNYRANTGLYAGNTLIVDDVELIYASTIQKLYINNKEWKGFDGSNTTGVQTYTLGQGATQMPSIVAYRGAGSLTNVHLETASFAGRQLQGSEIQIVPGTIDGTPTRITVTAEDGSSTTTYQIQFVTQQSSNARLAGIEVNGQPVAGFNAMVNTYNVTLPFGTTTLPVVTATKQEDTQQIEITQATSTSGKATIVVTAQDGTTRQTYTVNFSVAQLADNTLQDILIDGVSLPGFVPSKSTYTVELPLGTTQAPVVTPVSAYPTGAQTITILSNTLDAVSGTGECKIQVSAPAASAAKTYTLKYKVTASTNAQLQMIYIDGRALDGFDASLTAYTINLPLGTVEQPVVTWTAGDAYQTITKTDGGVDGTTRLLVTAAAGNSLTYKITFQVEKSSLSTLQSILVNGVEIANFDAQTLTYDILLPAGTMEMPVITWVAGDDYQTVKLVNGGLISPSRILVTAGDGSTSVYVLNISVEKSASALLEMILLDGVPMTGFDAETFDYRYHLAIGQAAPAISVLKADGQTVAVMQPLSTGTARIIVQPEEGEPNTYTITFYDDAEVVCPEPATPSYTPSSNADLAMIYLNGDSLDGFDAAVTEYTVWMDRADMEQPLLTATVADNLARMIVYTQGEANADASIRVLAEDSLTVRNYILHFRKALLSNPCPEDIELDGRITYRANQYEYTVELPFGTAFPDVFVTKADESQRVEISYMNCKTRRDVLIQMTAEDGTQAAYTIHMTIPTHPDNVLLAIYGEHFMLDSAALNSADTVIVSLPYNATELGISSILKNYDDQYVVVRDGGLDVATTIWTYSGRPGELVRRYTLLPELQASPYLFTDLQVDGATIAGFRPGQHEYILSVSATPAINAMVQDGVELELVSGNQKFWQARALVAGEEGPLYTVWFYYPGDVTFSQSFEDWASVSNTLADVDLGTPVGWHNPIDATTTGDKGSYHPAESLSASTDATDGHYSASLKTAYLLTSAEAMPGILSLSPQTVTVGTYYILSHTASTISFGDAITFRNTPDSVALDYKTISANKVTGWHWVWKTSSSSASFDYEGNYNTKDRWLSVGRRLHYDDTYVPTTLDIRINPAHSFTLNDYYVGTGGISTGNRFTSSMLVDHLQMFYYSHLSALLVNGQPMTLASEMSVDVDTESMHAPLLECVKGDGEQAPVITWSPEVNGVREALIRNYAEDLSYTDYTLTVRRALSAENGHTVADKSWADVYFRTLSQHATADVHMSADSLIVEVTSETGLARRSAYVAYVHDSVRTIIPAVLMPAGRDSVMQDSIVRVLSENLDLQAILIDGVALSKFQAYQLSYTQYTAPAAVVEPVAGDAEQTITTEHVALSDGSDLYYIHVRAGNGATRVYSLQLTHTLPSADASLQAIRINGVDLADFASDTYSYDINLPAHSTLPDIVGVPTDVHASLLMERSGNTITLSVTSEDGENTNLYTLHFTIPASDYCTLQMLLLDGMPVENFLPEQTTYHVTLPVGTTALPELSYVLLEKQESVHIDTTVLAAYEGAYRLTVTAEDGIHQMTYEVLFTVAKSANALLADVLASGVSLPDFDAQMESPMVIKVPYGAQVPVITWTLAEEHQSVVVDTLESGLTLLVTAEDGITTRSYTIHFDMLRSTCATLNDILLGGESLADFAKDEYDYAVELPYGSESPVVTYVAGDEQQTVTVSHSEENGLITYVLHVLAGNGEDEAEYTLHISFAKSDNCLLSDLQVRGTTIEGFRSDVMEYTIVYPWGTPESALLHAADVLAVAQDAAAQVSVQENEDHSITIMVLADNGIDRAVYTIYQQIEPNALLAMIYINDVPLRDFEPTKWHYDYLLPEGAQAPKVEAVAQDTLCDVEYSIVLIDDTTYIYSTSPDGAMTAVYTLYISTTTVSSAVDADVDDVAFVQVKGTNRFVAVTIRSNVQIGVYTIRGQLLMLENVPVCDPNYVRVEKDEQGNEYIAEVYDGANGAEFEVPYGGVPYIYLFYKSTDNKRFTRGGKIMLDGF